MNEFVFGGQNRLGERIMASLLRGHTRGQCSLLREQHRLVSSLLREHDRLMSSLCREYEHRMSSSLRRLDQLIVMPLLRERKHRVVASLLRGMHTVGVGVGVVWWRPSCGGTRTVGVVVESVPRRSSCRWLFGHFVELDKRGCRVEAPLRAGRASPLAPDVVQVSN